MPVIRGNQGIQQCLVSISCQQYQSFREVGMGCITHRERSCFSPSGPRFESRLYCLVPEQLRKNLSRADAKDFTNAVQQRPKLSSTNVLKLPFTSAVIFSHRWTLAACPRSWCTTRPRPTTTLKTWTISGSRGSRSSPSIGSKIRSLMSLPKSLRKKSLTTDKSGPMPCQAT